jgi:DNA-binding transcriptional ArsR family regulator
MKQKIESSLELMKLYSFIFNVKYNKEYREFSPTIKNIAEKLKKNQPIIVEGLKSLIEQGLVKEVKSDKEFEYIPIPEKFFRIVSDEIFRVINSGYPDLYKKKYAKLYKKDKLKTVVKRIINENSDIFTNYLTGCLLEENVLDYYLDDLIERFLLTVLYIEYCWDIPEKKEDKKWLELVKIAEMYALVIFNVPIVRILTRWVGEEYFYPTLDSYLGYFFKKKT